MTKTDLLDSLTNPVTSNTPVQVPKARLRGSFFFNLDSDSEEQLRRKLITEKKVIPQSDREIEARTALYKEELPESLRANIDKVREFLLSTLGPLTLAADTGLTQAIEVLGRATDSQVDPGIQKRFEIMVHRGANIKLSKFIARYLGLSAKDAQVLLDSITPVRPSTIMFPGLDSVKAEGPMRGGTRNEKAKGKVKEVDSGRVLPGVAPTKRR